MTSEFSNSKKVRRSDAIDSLVGTSSRLFSNNRSHDFRTLESLELKTCTPLKILCLKEKNTELEEKIDGLESGNAELENEISGLKKQVEKLKAGKDVDTVNAL